MKRAKRVQTPCVTDESQANPFSPTLPGGKERDGFTGVFPSPEGHGSPVAARDRSAMVVGQFHGILTGQSSPTWPTFGTGYLDATHPEVETVNAKYYALPLPRIEALRNRRRSRELAGEIYARMCMALADLTPANHIPISIVAHSNGGVLALQVARILIGWGVALRALVLIAPALRTGPATREILEWMERGMLDRAVLVRPTRDLVIGGIGANWRTKLFSWPWGSLGHDGWDLDAMQSPAADAGLLTLDLPDMGHSDPVAPVHRQWLYESVILPALGLAPWGELQPKGGLEE